MVYGCFAVAVITSLRAVLARLTFWTVGIALLLSLALGLMVTVDQGHANHYLAIAVECLVLAVPWMFVANSVESYGHFLRYLYGAAVAVVVAGAVRILLPGEAVHAASYSQYDGYQVLPAAVIFVDALVRRPRLRTGLLAVAALVLMLASGARGPLVAVVLYGLARGVLALRGRPRAAVFLLAAGLVVTQAFDIVLRALSAPLSQAFISRGFSTRSLDRLVEGDFLQDRTRSAVARLSWDLILQHPLTGVGVARDRLLLARAMGVSDPETVQGWYPHNVVLELLLQYGIFLGGALVLLLAVILLRSVLNKADPERARVVLLFGGIGLFPLFVSGSYLTSPLFFALVGFCVSSPRATKKTLNQPAASDRALVKTRAH